MGCIVSTAQNGEVALSMMLEEFPSVSPASEQPRQRSASVSRSVFSVVFLDNQMPVMSGLQVVAKLRELGRCDFVVGVTGNALITDQKVFPSFLMCLVLN